MPDILKPIWSSMQKIGRFLKNTWASMSAYVLYVRARFAPKPDGFEETMNRIRANDPQLTHLDLRWKRLSSWNAIELCHALATNTTLTSLDVSENQIGDAGAQALAMNRTLTSLNVGENQIGDAGAQALATNTTLTVLNVCWNNIDPANTLLLRNAIIRNIEAKKTMARLDAFASISNNDFQSPQYLPEDVVQKVGSFLTTDQRCLNDIRLHARDRSLRHVLFQPVGTVDSAAPSNQHQHLPT